ncbi:VanZ family protein [Aquibacillus sediminis]|uniref:VanZ family protein n=1 Tax=Aquibacillus sediminis TaxID=2574734 RepID=UPI001108BD39|nr:VanZ family protein [Aquibacillus sediminis]
MKKCLYWLPAIIWMGVIFYSSSQPYQNQDIKPFLSDYVDLTFLIPFVDWVSFTYHNSVVSVHEMGIYSFVEFFIRKGAHVTVFFILMLAFYYAFSKTWQKRTSSFLLVISFISTTVYAAFDEWHQGITPNRTPYVGDVLLDGFGGLIGVGLLLLFTRIRRKQ